MFKGKLASDEAVKCYDDVLKSINDLNEDNAKALLKQVYARLDIVQNGNGEYKSEQCVTDLISSFTELVRFANNKKEN
ncbi:hypothetical protein GCM10007063_33570 [Lentibacillus kapialis]|uniref:Uncharacterized protein n=1 Tax=Lentibacillus kapialis TaxID=340214 RepID=A0A917Q2K4_9BACI|nr:hypothetical protein [Lentibacillus kapialis]GGK08436.1 hypothetical protein GCM10007063_33570 [Lentibacillus kapialis]